MRSHRRSACPLHWLTPRQSTDEDEGGSVRGEASSLGVARSGIFRQASQSVSTTQQVPAWACGMPVDRFAAAVARGPDGERGCRHARLCRVQSCPRQAPLAGNLHGGRPSDLHVDIAVAAYFILTAENICRRNDQYTC